MSAREPLLYGQSCLRCRTRGVRRPCVNPIAPRLCARCVRRDARVERSYAERWDDRAAREVARWARLLERVERDSNGASPLVNNGVIALNAIANQTTGASRPSQRVRDDWRRLRVYLREIAAGIDPLEVRAKAREGSK